MRDAAALARQLNLLGKHHGRDHVLVLVSFLVVHHPLPLALDCRQSVLTPEILERVIEESKQLASEGKHGLLYIDDQAYALKNKRIEQLLRLIYFNSRHMHLSSIIISQTLRQVGVNIRKTASHLLTYEPANRLESKVIAEEFLYLDPASAAALFEQAFQKRFDHLLINTGERRAYINFDEVTLPRSF